MSESSDCQDCPVFGPLCEGSAEGTTRCRDFEGWQDAIDGLELSMPLLPQPQFELPAFFPQLLNGLEVPSLLAREPAIAVGIAKALTPRGRPSRRALPERYGTHSLRAQWRISEDTRLLCTGNTLDGYLERLWRAQNKENVWGRLQGLGFDAATSLNFSIYLDRPRLEHLANIKRTWLTVQRMQQTSGLIPIPHLQWAAALDLERQLHFALEQGFHTLTLNLQMIKRQGWDTVVTGIPILQEQASGLRLLITGVAGLKRMAVLAEAFPGASFTNTTAHYLAQRYVRLRRDGTRLIKEPVEGHPDLILAENVRLYGEFLTATNRRRPDAQVSPTTYRHQAARDEVVAVLREQFGFDAMAARDAFDLLATDEAVLAMFETWQHSGELDRDFQGAFPTWPCAGCVSHPTLGQLVDEGADPIDAFLHLAHLAHQVYGEIEVLVGQAGY